MSFSDWLIIGALGILARKARISAAEENERNEREYKKYKDESFRRSDINSKRENTPCKFKDGITYKDFSDIAYKAGKKIKRIKNVIVCDAVIHCDVESQTGLSKWSFYVDFNDWGHVTGVYWKYAQNHHSNIPERFIELVLCDIKKIMLNKDIHLPNFSSYVDKNKELGGNYGLSYFSDENFLKKIFCVEKKLISQFDSQDLVGEHIYLVVSLLKSNGYKNIKSIPIKDRYQSINKYIYEVEQVVINQISFFEVGDIFLENAEVIITYNI